MRGLGIRWVAIKSEMVAQMEVRTNHMEGRKGDAGGGERSGRGYGMEVVTESRWARRKGRNSGDNRGQQRVLAGPVQ